MKEKKNDSTYQKLINGIEEIISSGKYKDFLTAMKNFHNYSFNNKILIYLQNPDATRVAGYCTWNKIGRGVKSNPKRIYILKPIPYKVKKKTEEKKETEENDEWVEFTKFGRTVVYDISDTYLKEGAKEVPLFDNIDLNSNTSKELYNVLLQISPVEVNRESTGNGSDGYYSQEEKKIVISSKLSQDDATITLLHEISHALYDDFDYNEDRDLSEIFVESIAFITADYFGLDTSKCSFSYITKWSNGDMKKILELGNKIQECSDKLIDTILKNIDCQKSEAA